MTKKLLLISVLALAVAGCESTSSLPYSVSTQNILAAQRVMNNADTTANIGTFTAAEGVEKPMCRLAGQLDIAPGKTVETFIRDAFEAELFQTGRLDSAGATINGEIRSMEVNTMGTGSWSFAVRVFSDRMPEGYMVSSSHSFASSFSAVAACQNAATAFNPAVQTLLNDIVTDPRFADLMR